MRFFPLPDLPGLGECHRSMKRCCCCSGCSSVLFILSFRFEFLIRGLRAFAGRTEQPGSTNIGNSCPLHTLEKMAGVRYRKSASDAPKAHVIEYVDYSVHLALRGPEAITRLAVRTTASDARKAHPGCCKPGLRAESRPNSAWLVPTAFLGGRDPDLRRLSFPFLQTPQMIDIVFFCQMIDIVLLRRAPGIPGKSASPIDGRIACRPMFIDRNRSFACTPSHSMRR